MGINLVVAVTDDEWFDTLRHDANLSEVNFWARRAIPSVRSFPGSYFFSSYTRRETS
jgi:hypothetical protein